MRSSIRSGGGRRALWTPALALVLFAGHAAAQGLNQTAVVVIAEGDAAARTAYEVAGYDPADIVEVAVDPATSSGDIQTALQDVIDRAVTAELHYTLIIDDNGGTPWPNISLNVPADADITILGAVGPQTFNAPYSIVLEGTDGLPVIQIDPPTDPEADVDLLEIDGLTLSSGLVGLAASNGTQATLNRVYIINNVEAGVRVEDDSDVLLVNCSIAENGEDGVLVSDGHAEVLFCSLIRNGTDGLRTEPSGTARVRNTLVFENTDDGLEAEDAGGIEVAVNNVFGNLDQDYVGVTADANSISDDPLLDDAAPWIGKLQEPDLTDPDNPIISPCIDAAADFELLPYTTEDFEAQVRPFNWDLNIVEGALFDIGADELSDDAALGLPIWYFCRVLPNPIPALDEGELDVEIRVTLRRNFAIEDDNLLVWITPQGLDPTILAQRIPIRITSSPRAGIYIGTNDIDITTVLGSTAAPTQSDLIADGHGAVYISVNGVIFDNTPEHELIRAAAHEGRQVLIDTIPPRLDPAILPAAAGAFITNHNDTTTALFVPGVHPGYPGLPGPAVYPPSTIPAPVDTAGTITNNIADRNTPGAQVFFNVGSRSNYLPPENLDIEVTVPFIDPPVLDPDGVEILDPTGASRPVSGFPIVTDAVTPVNLTNEGPGRWQFIAGQSLMSAATATLVYNTTGTQTAPAVGPPGVFLSNNENTALSWTFEDMDPAGNPGPVPGLSWVRARDNLFHVSTRFQGVDRAGNITPFDETLAPLQIWWLIEARTRFVPNQEGGQIQFPITWQLNRTIASPTLDLPKPIFTYRLWHSANLNGPYTPVTGWSNWDVDNQITFTEFSSLGILGDPTYAGHWFLLVVGGADEAGNVEPWPIQNYGVPPLIAPTFQIANIDDPIAFAVSPGLNWMRFQLGDGGVPDTGLTATFWHNRPPLDQRNPVSGETNFGSQNLLPTPSDHPTVRLEARFDIQLLTQNPGSLTDLQIRWELVPNGQEGFFPTQTINLAGTVTAANVVIPLDFDPSAYTGAGNGLSHPQFPVNWVFRAWAGATLPGDTAPTFDETPATFAFTVVPSASIEDYVRNFESPERQPIKIQEDQ